MIRHFVFLWFVGVAVAFCCCVTSSASDWVFRPAPFTHDPVTGERVTQYSPEVPTYAQVDPTYQQSGQVYQHLRFRNGSGSFDHYLLRQRWGSPWSWYWEGWR